MCCTGGEAVFLNDLGVVMSDIDRIYAEDLMRKAGLDALVLFQP